MVAGNVNDFPIWHKVVGITLALSSALLIGASFPGEGHGYLKNPLWWAGLILMLVGELCNVAAYAFSPAILVTPLRCCISDFFLKEKLNFSAKIGSSNSTTTLQSFWSRALDPIFIVYFLINAIILAYLIFYASPRWGDRWPLVFISICSIMGSFVVVAMQGLGSAVVYTFANPSANQFKEWSMYLLLVFVVLTGVLQINYLNKALNIFSTAIVTPIYYVFFTTATLLCSAILLRDFMFDTAINGISALVGFLVIIGGVALLFAYSLQTAKAAKDMNLKKRSSSLRYGTNHTSHPSHYTGIPTDEISPHHSPSTRRIHDVSESGTVIVTPSNASSPAYEDDLHPHISHQTPPSMQQQRQPWSSPFLDDREPTAARLPPSSAYPYNTHPQTLFDRESPHRLDSDSGSSQGYPIPRSATSSPEVSMNPASRLTIDTPPGGFSSLVPLTSDDEGERRRGLSGMASRTRKGSEASDALLIEGAVPLGGQEEDEARL
ncbi:magnesium transporter NIPA-domain-containing protein [Chytridium lagenaria]|nr:magnesium transporter NIPA-domain-containing protein [Chytridium lagenaria]